MKIAIKVTIFEIITKQITNVEGNHLVNMIFNTTIMLFPVNLKLD